MTSPKDPTADYRKYPKGPNFLGIVIGASVFLILAFVIAYFFLGLDVRHLIPARPKNPQPNSLARPLFPAPTPPRAYASHFAHPASLPTA